MVDVTSDRYPAATGRRVSDQDKLLKPQQIFTVLIHIIYKIYIILDNSSDALANETFSPGGRRTSDGSFSGASCARLGAKVSMDCNKKPTTSHLLELHSWKPDVSPLGKATLIWACVLSAASFRADHASFGWANHALESASYH